MKNRYILYNQAVIPRESLNISPEEWFAHAAHCIHQNLFASGNRIPFLNLWLELINQQFETVGWHLPAEFSFGVLKTQLEKLLNRNRLFKGSWIHLMILPVFPSTELDCSPDFKWIALTEEIESDCFPMNDRGLSIGISEKYHNTGDPFYSSIVRSPLRKLLIQQEEAINGWDEIILTDQNGFLSEASESNIFMRFNEEIVTPAPANHCFPRIMTAITKNLIVESGIHFSENDRLRPQDLTEADEVFLTDDRNGFRWVLGFEKKRYYRKVSTGLHESFTHLINNIDQFQIGFSG